MRDYILSGRIPVTRPEPSSLLSVWLARLTVWGLAALLVLAAVDKLFHYNGFETALRSYVILPKSLAPYFALFVILAELWIATGLLLPQTRRIAAGSAVVALIVFAVASAVNAYYAPSAPCGCWFTLTLGESSVAHILLNLFLAGLAFSLVLERPLSRYSES